MAVKSSPTWQDLAVVSPNLPEPVSVVAALGVPYRADAHRFQTINIYVPKTASTMGLLGEPVTGFQLHQGAQSADGTPKIQVHIHGGAWRDPDLSARSIEAAVAHSFHADAKSQAIDAIIGINYTLSPFPTHPTKPYDPVKNGHSDPAREGFHPQHVTDVIQAFNLLEQQFGLTDGSYILTGHSAGACLCFQAILKPPSYWGQDLVRPPTPAAIACMNGLYDLVELVYGLGPTHKALRGVYEQFQRITFGEDETKWSAYSPARFDIDAMSARVAIGEVPTLILLDQSLEDQLVPENQVERLRLQLGLVDGMQLVKGKRCTGTHAAPWEQGFMIRETVQDVLTELARKS